MTLLALYQQRMIRTLAGNPALARQVVAKVPSLRNDVTARVDLDRLAAQTKPLRRKLRVGPAASAQQLLRWYQAAGRRFGVRWQVLAAINFTESAFGKVKNSSSAGAQGPMQFLPATWKAYGLGGDINDPKDAILAAANYLNANGARRNERAALLHYNHSALYVDAVTRYANRIGQHLKAFFAYYAWQIYVRTATGSHRITGPR